MLSYDKLLPRSIRPRARAPGSCREVTLTDTVGFIQKLPTTLVEAAFKSTLDEIRGADLVLHVIDASSPERECKMKAVEETLQQIDAQTIPRITVFNKIDLVDDAQAAALARYPGAVLVSAATDRGGRAYRSHRARCNRHRRKP